MNNNNTNFWNTSFTYKLGIIGYGILCGAIFFSAFIGFANLVFYLLEVNQ